MMSMNTRVSCDTIEPVRRIALHLVFFALSMSVACALQAATAPAGIDEETESTPASKDTQALTWLKSENYAALDAFYSDLQRRYEAGEIPDTKLYGPFRDFYRDDASNSRWFNAWVSKYPKSYVALTARGAYFYRMAWAVRGAKFISETDDRNLAKMEAYADLARRDLTQSMTLTSKPYLSALYLLNTDQLSGSAKVRRRWLDLGTTIDPNNLLVRRRYLATLLPRWGGSYEKMDAFIKECADKKAPERTMVLLKFDFANEFAGDLPKDATHAMRYAAWSEAVKTARAANVSVPERALAGYAKYAWTLNRRAEADTALAELAKRNVNDAWSLSQMGFVYVNENRMKEAWVVLQKAAALDDRWSQFAIGKTLVQGCADLNLAPNRAAGLEWIKLSADHGFKEAIDYLNHQL